MLMEKGDKNLEKDSRKKEGRQEYVDNSNKNLKKNSRKQEGNTRATTVTNNSNMRQTSKNGCSL